ncbi:hypothetical protein GCM10009855_05120 [Gordonia cholesterolivorans]
MLGTDATIGDRRGGRGFAWRQRFTLKVREAADVLGQAHPTSGFPRPQPQALRQILVRIQVTGGAMRIAVGDLDQQSGGDAVPASANSSAGESGSVSEWSITATSPECFSCSHLVLLIV